MFRYSFNELRSRNCDFPDIFLLSYPQYFIYDLSDNKNFEDKNRDGRFK